MTNPITSTTPPERPGAGTDVWVLQLHYSGEESPGPVIAVCADRDLAYAIRSEMREHGFEGGRLAIKYAQVVSTSQHALTAAYRWLDILKAGATS